MEPPPDPVHRFGLRPVIAGAAPPSPSPFDLCAKQLWPTTCYLRCWSKHQEEALGILRHLYEVKAGRAAAIASGVALGAKSGYGLFESDFDLFASGHLGLRRLHGFIEESVRQAVSHANNSEVDPRRIRVEIADSWFHVSNDGGFHDAHYHGGCSWCGIYYLQVGDAGPSPGAGAPNGGSRFYSPLVRGGGHGDYGTRYLERSTSVDAPIQDGLLLLFPSYLLHCGLPYRGQKDRIVIAFNTRSYLLQP